MGLGQQARGAGELGRARELLAAGLALWRGPAFVGFSDLPVVDVAAQRLTERRLVAWEALADLDLVLGRHADLLVELPGLIVEHPFRDRLREQLLLAFYRSGRQAEALEVYQQTWQLYNDELGLPPGRRLQDLHRGILRADPDLDLAVVPDPATAPTIHLPGDTADFTGFAAELTSVSEQLQGADAGDRTVARVVVVCGQGGAGKTTLAIHAAHAMRSEFPDGQILVTVHVASFTEVLGWLLRALGLDDTRSLPLQDKIERYRLALAGKRVLLVFDDVRSADQIRPLLPIDARCAAIMTSRPHPTPRCRPRRMDHPDPPRRTSRLRLLPQRAGQGLRRHCRRLDPALQQRPHRRREHKDQDAQTPNLRQKPASPCYASESSSPNEHPTLANCGQ